MQAEARDLRRAIKKCQETLAGHEAARLIADALPTAGPSGSAGVHVVVEALDGWDANGLKAIASAVTAGTRAVVALCSTTSPFTLVIARSADASVDANAILRALTERFGGRGGGKPDLAQGGGLTGDLNQITQAARSLLISNPS
jgi:alanyl-tRNA synthetase